MSALGMELPGELARPVAEAMALLDELVCWFEDRGLDDAAEKLADAFEVLDTWRPSS